MAVGIGPRLLFLQRGDRACVIGLQRGDPGGILRRPLLQQHLGVVLVHQAAAGGEQGDAEGDDAEDLADRAAEDRKNGEHAMPQARPALRTASA